MDKTYACISTCTKTDRIYWPPKVSREAQLKLQKFVFIFKMIIMTKTTLVFTILHVKSLELAARVTTDYHEVLWP